MSSGKISIVIFKSTLFVYGTLTFFMLGLAHLLAPEWYFEVTKVTTYNPEDPFSKDAAQLVGAFSTALGVGAWMVFRDAARNRNVFLIILIAMTLALGVVVYTLLIGGVPPIAWYTNAMPGAVMLLLLTVTYPWKEARRYHRGHGSQIGFAPEA